MKNPTSSDNLSSKDVKDIGKSVLKTTIVWTLAGFLTQTIRQAVKDIFGKNNIRP